MASSLEYVDYVCEQMELAGKVTYRKMFGEYTIYCGDKVLGLICDNEVYIKPTKAGKELLPDAVKQSPYTGAKPYILLEELDDKEFLKNFIIATCDELPMPRPKKKKLKE